MLKSRDEFDLTSGSVAKPLFYLSLPIVITNLLRTAYNLADTFWVGQLSTEALAAISFAFPLVFLLIALGMGISVTGSVLVAQNVGAGRERAAEYAASQTVSFAAIASVVLGGLGYVAVEDLLRILGAAPAVVSLGTTYMQIISLGIFFMFGFAVFIALMRGYGDTVTPMLVMLGSVVLNIALDPFLLFGWWLFPELGIAGAAIATVFSRGLAFVVGLGIMLSGTRGVRIRPSDMRPDPDFLRKMIRIGVPASVEGTGRALSVNAVLAIVGMFATPVVAGYGIAVRVFSVIFLPAIAVGQGVETMTGQNVGAGELDRVKRANDTAAVGMFLVLSVIAVFVFVFAGPIVAVFTTNAAVVANGTEFLRIVAPTFGFIGVVRAYAGGFRGAGRTLVAAVVSVGMLGGIRLPLAWIGANAIGSEGIWYAFTISNFVGAAIAFLWFRRGTWRGESLAETDESRADGQVDPATD